jgi:hypothetical protein
MERSQTVPAPPTTYPEPEIVVQRNSDWKARNPKELKPTQRKIPEKKSRKNTKVKRQTRKQAIQKKMVKFIELLQGVGGKGSRIKIKVNCFLFEKRRNNTFASLLGSSERRAKDVSGCYNSND